MPQTLHERRGRRAGPGGWYFGGVVIGCVQISLHIPQSESLKDKRQVIRSLTARIRNQFSVAIAEVADQNLWQSAGLGVVCVSSDARHADEVCQKVVAAVEQEAEAIVTGSKFEMIHV
jgi:uncharacterized protein YlxP (DUF503 family)